VSDLLRVEELKVNYYSSKGKVYALRGVSFNIKRGEIYGIIGETGSGKTTICHAVMGFIGKKADISGRIFFKGRNLLTLKEKELRKLYCREMALLPQSIASLNPLMTIGTHIEETLRARSNIRGAQSLKKKALDLLMTFQFSDPKLVYRSFPSQLSGGMNQRAVMAITFCCSPSLVIADEPTKSLDLGLKDSFLETMDRLKGDRNISMLIVTHDLEVVEKVCDGIAVIYDGLFVETGKAGDVMSMPLHPYTRSLIQALPKNGMCPTWGFAPSSLENNDGCSFQPRCPVGKRLEKKHIVPSSVMVGKDHLVWCCDVKG